MTNIKALMARSVDAAHTARLGVSSQAAPPNPPMRKAEAVTGYPPSPALAAAMQKIFTLDDSESDARAAHLNAFREDLRKTEGLATEARERLAAVSAQLAARPDPAALVDWLLGLGELVERTPTGEALMGAVKALALNLEVPKACLTDAAMRAVARELVWWPSFAKLEPAMLRQVAGLEAERRRLQAIMVAAVPALPAPTVPARVRKEPPAEEVREVLAKAKALQDATPPRKKKRWTLPPVGPMRSVEDQLAALRTWDWQPKLPADDPSQANAADIE